MRIVHMVFFSDLVVYRCAHQQSVKLNLIRKFSLMELREKKNV